MNILLLITAAISIVMILAALSALYQKNLAAAIISAGLVSLIASILYLILAAPDVAMTEAAIGSGLSTIIFFYVLNKVRGGENG